MTLNLLSLLLFSFFFSSPQPLRSSRVDAVLPGMDSRLQKEREALRAAQKACGFDLPLSVSLVHAC